MTAGHSGELAEALSALARREAELEACRRQVADLDAELEATSRGLIALHAELENARQAEARLAAIVQFSDDAMFSTTADGEIQTWNPGAERLFGYGAAEAAGRPADMLVPSSSLHPFGEVLEQVRSAAQARSYDTRLRRGDGGLFDAAVTVSPMDDSGGAPAGFSVVVRDITDRLRLEAELAAVRAQQEVMSDRERIARDLHDMVIQRIFGAGLALQATAGMVRHPQAEERIRKVIGELDVTIHELRTAIFDLQHPPQQETTLRAAVLQLTTEAAERLGFSPAVAFEGPIDSAVSDEVAVQLLAVLREALSNIVRHARASGAEVVLSAGADLVLRITDDGRGLGETTRSSGLGNMGERARELGGVFEAVSPPSGGTRLVWRVPLS
ncbi:PAS domain S-box protein [Planomonospora corallina]|uniref:PAS domain S-box protein n=1 Tax=Planomonospora corallina TaxID=1806052 RepID=A0ABV8IAY3_9ACTN